MWQVTRAFRTSSWSKQQQKYVKKKCLAKNVVRGKNNQLVYKSQQQQKFKTMMKRRQNQMHMPEVNSSMITFRKPRSVPNVFKTCCKIALDPPRLFVFPTYEKLVEMIKLSLDDEFIEKKREEKEKRFKQAVNLLMKLRV